MVNDSDPKKSEGIILKERFYTALEQLIAPNSLDHNELLVDDDRVRLIIREKVAQSAVPIISLVTRRPGRKVDQISCSFLAAFNRGISGSSPDYDRPIDMTKTEYSAQLVGEWAFWRCGEGKITAVVVPMGALSAKSLAAGRIDLLERGMLRHVVYLPLGCFQDSTVAGAILILSEHNEEVTFTSCSTDVKTKEVKADQIKTLPRMALAESEGRLDRAAIDNFGLLQAGGDCLGNHLKLFIGLNLSRVPEWEQRDMGEVRALVGPSDFESGAICSSKQLRLIPKSVGSSISSLRDGDIIIPRTASNPRAFIYSAAAQPPSVKKMLCNDVEIIPASTLIVARPYRQETTQYFLAFLNSRRGLAMACTGGRTKHLGVDAIQRLLLPKEWKRICRGVGEAYGESLRIAAQAQKMAGLLEDMAAGPVAVGKSGSN